MTAFYTLALPLCSATVEGGQPAAAAGAPGQPGQPQGGPQYYKPKEPTGEEVSPLEMPPNATQLEKIRWGSMYPIHYMCRLTMPDCRQEQYRRWYPFTFVISMVWISFYSYIMVWMITVIGEEKWLDASQLSIPRTSELWTRLPSLRFAHCLSHVAQGARWVSPTPSWGWLSSQQAWVFRTRYQVWLWSKRVRCFTHFPRASPAFWFENGFTILNTPCLFLGYGDMAVSNAVGSNVFDILICLGLPWFLQTALIAPGSHVNVYSKGTWVNIPCPSQISRA